MTIGGTVSPAGGNFEEPVTQATLKVVGAFHGLSRERSDQRRYPAINPLESWSKYAGPVDARQVEFGRRILREGNEVSQMMKVVGEEGTSMEDFITHLKSEFLDAVYLQQDAFHEVDASTPADRQAHVFARLHGILNTGMKFPDKDEARRFFLKMTQVLKEWNRVAMQAPEFADMEKRIERMVTEVADYA